MADPAPPARRDPIALAAVALFFLFALFQAIGTNNFPDFFIFRAGAAIGVRGESPYDIPRIRAAVAGQYPDAATFIANCGYFLPPMSVLLFAPFVPLSWPAAKVAWAVAYGLGGAAIVTIPGLFARPGAPPEGQSLGRRIVPLLLLLNFLTLAVVMVGQFAVVFVGCVAAGQRCFERNRPTLGVLLWAVPFVKPHVALPLLGLAWYLGGWRRAAAVLGVVAGLNLLGATLVGGSPLFLRDYLAFLSVGPREVEFNRAALNLEMTSWNRLLYVATAPFAGERFLVEQTAVATVASYLVWLGLVVGRCALAGGRPSAAWAAAATAAGAVVCPQVLGYELLFLAVAVPWVRDLFAAGYRVRGWAAVLVLGLQTIPFQVASAAGVEFHRPLGAMLFAVLVLLGPIDPLRRETQPGEPGA